MILAIFQQEASRYYFIALVSDEYKIYYQYAEDGKLKAKASNILIIKTN